MNFYPRFVGDYIRDTGHLSLAEHGAYNILLDHYYATERPITRINAMKLCHAVSKSDKAAVESVLSEFFHSTDQGYRNARADREISKAKEKSKKAKQSINARWGQRNTDTNVLRTNDKRNTNEILTNNQYPITKRDSVENSSINSYVGRKGPVPVSRLLKGVLSDD